MKAKRDAEMRERYSYTLTLRVNDHGEREFTATGECNNQTKMAADLASNIARALGIMNAPPAPADLVYAMNPLDRGVLQTVAYLYSKKWTGESNFDDCFRVTVDMGKLAECSDAGEFRTAVSAAKRAGFEVVGVDESK